jgi:hypothetical protein
LPISPGHPAESLYTSGWDCAGTLVIHENDAFRGNCAFRHLERHWDRGRVAAFLTMSACAIYAESEGETDIEVFDRAPEIATIGGGERNQP